MMVPPLRCPLAADGRLNGYPLTGRKRGDRFARPEGLTPMKAAYIERVGPPENIRFGELPTPTVGPSDVLVKTTAVCVDPVDTLIRSGRLPEELPFPFIVGRDMVGVVEAIGPAVTRFARGDRVWCNNQGHHGRQGTFAEYLSVHENLLYPLPQGADGKEVAA